MRRKLNQIRKLRVSSETRASHASRAFARLTQAFFEDQPSHVRRYRCFTAVLPQGLSYRPASAKGDVGEEGRKRFCCLSGAAVPGSMFLRRHQ